MNEHVQPEIVNKPGFTVIGLKNRCKNRESGVRELWRQFTERWEEVQQAGPADMVCGLRDHFDTESGEFDYLAGVEVEAVDSVPDGMEAWDVEAQNYAVFPTTLSGLNDTYRYASDSWLQESNYRRTPGPEFEQYSQGFNPDNPDSRLDLYIPVEPLAGGE